MTRAFRGAWAAVALLGAPACAWAKPTELDGLMASLRGLRACVRTAAFEETFSFTEVTSTGTGRSFSRTVRMAFNRPEGWLRVERISMTPTGQPRRLEREGMPRRFREPPRVGMRRAADLEPAEVFGLPEFLAGREITLRHAGGKAVLEARSPGTGRHARTEVTFDEAQVPVSVRYYDSTGRAVQVIKVTWRKTDDCLFPQEVTVTSSNAAGTTRSRLIRREVLLNVTVSRAIVPEEP